MAMNDVTQEQAFDFARATPKWVWNSTGTLVEVPVDQPAYDHDPVTGEPLGVLIEPSRTNYIVSDNVAVYGELSLTTDVDSGKGLGKIWEATNNTGSAATGAFVRWDTQRDGLTEHVISVLVKPSPGIVAAELKTYHTTEQGIWSAYFDLTTGAMQGGSRAVPVENTDVGDGWRRIAARVPAGTPTNYKMLGVIGSDTYAGASSMPDGTSLKIALPQYEEGSVATSYIPTAGAAVTRAADSMSRSLGAEFNPSAGTIFIEYESPIDVSGTYGRGGGLLFRLSGNGFGGNGNQFVAGRFSGYLNFTFRDTDGTGFDTDSGTAETRLPYGQKNKIAVCYNSGVGFISAVNGTSATFQRPDLPSVNWSAMSLTTSYYSDTFFGHKSDVRYYPYAMTAAELEALTTL